MRKDTRGKSRWQGSRPSFTLVQINHSGSQVFHYKRRQSFGTNTIPSIKVFCYLCHLIEHCFLYYRFISKKRTEPMLILWYNLISLLSKSFKSRMWMRNIINEVFWFIFGWISVDSILYNCVLWKKYTKLLSFYVLKQFWCGTES